MLNIHTFWLEGHVRPEVQDALRVSGYSVYHTHGWNGDEEPQTKVTYQTVSPVATVDVIEG